MGLALGRRRGQLAAGGVRAPADRPGDVESFTSWVRPHLVVMSRLAARLSPRGDCDDVVQEALTAAWRKWHSYDPARGSAQSWLLAVVADQAGKARRRIRPVVDLVDGAHRDHHSDVDLDAPSPRSQRVNGWRWRCTTSWTCRSRTSQWSCRVSPAP